MIIRNIYWFICTILPFASLNAQTAYHISTSREFNTDMVTDVIRDRKNNMWIGSYNGLYKHEGARIRSFSRIGETTDAISGLEIHCLLEDRKGFIWVGTTNGIDKIHPITYTVQHISLKNKNSSNDYLGYITSLFQDDESNIWVATETTVFIINPETLKYRPVPNGHTQYSIPSTTMSRKPAITDGNGVWFLTLNGLIYYEYKTGKYFHRFHNPGNRPIFNLAGESWGNPSDLMKDKQGNIWFVLQENTLVKYNPANDQSDRFPFTRPANAWNCCYSLIMDDQENIWIGFRHGGILHFDTEKKKFTPIKHNPGMGLLNSNFVYGLGKDYQGNIWVTTDNGIDVINYYNKALRQVQLSQNPDYVRMIHQSADMSRDDSNNIYIPFYRTGFFRYDYREDSISFHKAGNQKFTGTTLIIPDKQNQNRVWAAREKGLIPVYLIPSFQSSTSHFPDLPTEVSKTDGDIIWAYFENASSAYIRKNSGALFHYKNGQTDSLTGYYWRKNLDISDDGKSLWYISGDLNLIRRDLVSLKEDSFNIQKKIKGIDFSFSNPRSVLQDGNAVWITSQNGLLRYYFLQDSLAIYSTENGLAHSFSFAVHKDKTGRIWVASFGGINYFNESENSFKTLLKFPTTSYMETFGSIIELSNHEIVFHAGNHLYFVNQNNIDQLNHQNFELALGEVSVNGQSIDWTEPGLLNNLKYDKNRIQARFGLLNFDRNISVIYWYRLHDKAEWINNGNSAELLFNALEPDNYLLQIKATDVSGNLLAEILNIPLVIKPPFWQTWWFISLITGLALIVLLFLYGNRIRNLKRKAQLEQQMTELESKALRAQMNPHFIFNSLNAIQELVVTERVEEAYTYLSRFSRLLRMVLNHSEKTSISLADEMSMLHLYIQLESLRFKGNFEHHMSASENVDEEMTWIPPLLVQPYIENAIWHGLSSKTGNKELRVEFSESANNLVCRIYDNGIGRKKAAEIKAAKLSAEKFESKGMKLSENRMRLINLQQKNHLAVQINDLYDAENVAIGTEVILTIPQTPS